MRRRVSGYKGPKTGKGKQEHPPRARSIENQVKDMERERAAVQMRLRGLSVNEIARQLKIDFHAASKAISRGFDEYREDHKVRIEKEMVLASARYDRFNQTWYPRAIGATTIDPETGEKTVIAPEHKAAMVWLRGQRDRNMLLVAAMGQTQRIELTGAAGGPVMTASVDEMDAARFIREAFGDAAAMGVTDGAAGDPSQGTKH